MEKYSEDPVIFVDCKPFLEYPEDPNSSIWTEIKGNLFECFHRSVDETPEEMRAKGYIEVSNPNPFKELWIKR